MVDLARARPATSRARGRGAACGGRSAAAAPVAPAPARPHGVHHPVLGRQTHGAGGEAVRRGLQLTRADSDDHDGYVPNRGSTRPRVRAACGARSGPEGASGSA